METQTLEIKNAEARICCPTANDKRSSNPNSKEIEERASISQCMNNKITVTISTQSNSLEIGNVQDTNQSRG
jgi:hypothetical protein